MNNESDVTIIETDISINNESDVTIIETDATEREVPLTDFITAPKPFIRRIISFIGDGIGKEKELIVALSSSDDDEAQIKRLIDDMIDNEDIFETRGISGRFFCLKRKKEEFKLAFEAIESTYEESGFFDNLFGNQK